MNENKEFKIIIAKDRLLIGIFFQSNSIDLVRDDLN
jgi:hypothetical protein